MPIYEFECTKCNAVFEKLVFASQKENQQTCPVCNSIKVQKLVSGFAMGAQTGASPSGFSSSNHSSSMASGGCSSGFSRFR